MNIRKVICLVLSLALMVSVSAPVTWAVEPQSGQRVTVPSGTEAPAQEQEGEPESDQAASQTQDCDCGENAPENLANHADSCPRKQYILGLIRAEGSGYKTAQAIYADWSGYDRDTQQDILNMTEVYCTTTYYELVALIEKDEPETDVGEIAIGELAALEEAYCSVTEDGCEDFFAEMMAAYGKAFENDVLVVSVSQLKVLDSKFKKLEDALYEDFGYSQTQSLASVPAVAAENGTAAELDSGIVTDKFVSQGEKGISDFLLTLESYVTGSSMDYTIPVDMILVLDQSASMYTPMGLPDAVRNTSVCVANSANLTRYALDSGSTEAAIGCLNLREAFGSTEIDATGLTFREKISQLGYLVAQSRSGASIYCKEDHSKHTDSCRTYDWFVVQYVENDADGKPWHFHRIKVTACPAVDSDNNRSYKDDVVRYASFDEMGAGHFYFYKSQTGALYDSILSFAKVLKESNGDHRLAIAGFSGWDIAGGDNKNPHNPGTCIYINGEKIAYDSTYEKQDSTYYSTITAEEYAKALVRVQGNYDGILRSLAAVTTDFYGTNQDVGFDMALNIIKNAPDVETDLEGFTRDKIVLLFTDGAPSGPEYGDIVAKAAEVKQTGAKVFTVCTSTLPAESREFLTVSSSDYPDANGTYHSKEFTSGRPIDTPKYAKTAENSDELMKQFVSIAEDVGGADVELNAEAILQDTISDDFSLPEDMIEKLESGESVTDVIGKYIHVFTADYDGNTFGEAIGYPGAQITILPDEQGEYRRIQVTNFDYAVNYVSKTGRGENDSFYGRKLIVTIAIDPAAENCGGNHLPTNKTKTTGIYSSGTKIADFPLPYVDVPTTVTVQKTVVGANSDTEKDFLFSYNAQLLSDYKLDDRKDHYLIGVTKLENSGFSLSHGSRINLSDLYVGEELTLQESQDPLYDTTIQVLDARGNDITKKAVVNQNGKLTIIVEPDMTVVYTNTVKVADLVIVKNGISSDLDENQSTLFCVTGPNGFWMDVVIVGNRSVTIKDLPLGNYTVTELTDWSWRYSLEQIAAEKDTNAVIDSTNKNIAFLLTIDGETVTFSNIREKDTWLSGDCYAENWWGRKKEQPGEA